MLTVAWPTFTKVRSGLVLTFHRERTNWLLPLSHAAAQGCWQLPVSQGYQRQEMLFCKHSWHAGRWSLQQADWVWECRVGSRCEWRFFGRYWSWILRRLRTNTQSLMLWKLIEQCPFKTAREQTWQGRASCSGLTQLVESWELLAHLR